MWPYPKVIVHRGGGSLAPENTMAAFEYGLNCGFHAVEFEKWVKGRFKIKYA